MYTNILMLEKVEFPSGLIDISYKSQTVGTIKITPFMEKFEVKNKNGSIHKTIDFLYGEGDYQATALLKFLKMNDETYTFNYNSKRYYKNSTGLDYWGYYNGKKNDNAIPKMNIGLYSNVALISGPYPNTSINIGYADRDIDAESMKAFMLERIDYPTGGYSTFEYESHRFPDQNPVSINAFGTMPAPINAGGGLRVFRITTKADANAQPIIKTYKYGVGENGLANVLYVPTLDTFVDEFCIYQAPACFDAPVTHRSLSINAFSNYSKYLIRNNPIWYSNVTEHVNDIKTEYFFDNNMDGKDVFELYCVIKKPYIRTYQSLFMDGPRLVKQTMYKKTGQIYSPVEQIISTYEKITGSIIKNWIIERQSINAFPMGGAGPDFYNPESPLLTSPYQIGGRSYNVYPYRILLDYYRLKNKQSISIINSKDSIKTTEEYIYNSRNQIQKTIKETSETSKKQAIEYKYPYNYIDAIYVDMNNKNMLYPVIEEITYNGTLEIQRIKNNYTNTSSITNGLIRRVSIQSSTIGASGLQTAFSFNKYDSHGNLLQYTLPDGTSTAYLWGYNYLYPIAKIENAVYSDVTAKIPANTLENIAAKLAPTASDLTTINNLRTQLPNAQISTYTYKPLVGIQTMTDPRGVTVTYEYDAVGRLKTIKDENNKVLENYDYHYKNQ
ncbi:hypothetical protein AGMMS4957_21680 [Bacteroidia bacterium]|nr:hypothetical protein AGMMS4957_21680 [Bacteroidia bacterium]